MAITATSLTSSSSTTPATSFNTASVSPGANKLILLFVASGDTGGATTVPTASGAGLTFSLVASQQQGTGNQRVTVLRAMSASPSSGAITIDFAGVTQENIGWTVVEVDGVVTSGTNGSGAIVQSKAATDSGNNVEVTLDSAVTSGNATFGIVTGNTQSPTYTAGSGFTLLGSGWSMAGPSNKGAVEWSSSGTNPVAFTDTGTPLCALVGLEVAAATSSPQTVSPSSIASGEAFGTPTVTGGGFIVAPTGIASGEAFGTPHVVDEGTYPDVIVEIAFSNTPNESASVLDWDDVTPYVRSVSWTRGSSNELNQVEAGQLTVVLDNNDRRFEPEYTGSPYYPNVQPLKRVRVRAAYGDGTVVDQIHAYVESWDNAYALGGDATATITASDGFMLLGQAVLPSAWEWAVRNAAPVNWWRFGEVDTTYAPVDAITGDASGSYENSVIVGEDGLPVGDSNTAAALGGLNDYIILGSPSISGAFTIGMWFSQAANQDDGDVLLSMMNGDTELELTTTFHATSGRQIFEFRLKDVASGDEGIIQSGDFTTPRPDGDLTEAPGMVWIAYDGDTTMYVYWMDDLNPAPNVPVVVSSLDGPITVTPSAIYVGAHADTPANYPTCTVDELLVFDRYFAPPNGGTGSGSIGTIQQAGDVSLASGTTVNIAGAIATYAGWPSVFAPGFLLNYDRQGGGFGLALVAANIDPPQGQSALDYMQALNVSENGQFFMSRDGKLTFWSRYEMFTPRSAGQLDVLKHPQITFGPGDDEVGYDGITFDFSEQQIQNEVRVTNLAVLEDASGNFSTTDQEYVLRDDASVERFNVRTLTLNTKIAGDTNQPSLHPVDVSDVIQRRMRHELTQRALPKRRVKSITFQPAADPANWPTVLDGVEFGYRVRVKFGDDIEQDLVITRISAMVTASPRSFVYTLELSEGGLRGFVFPTEGIASGEAFGVPTVTN